MMLLRLSKAFVRSGVRLLLFPDGWQLARQQRIIMRRSPAETKSFFP
jgi:hypothetical protein